MRYVSCSDMSPRILILDVTMEEYNYDALASTIKVEDITSDEQNQDIIRQLKENDPNRDLVCICDEDNAWSENDYCPVEEEMGWLGYYIGQNTSLWRLWIDRIDIICSISFCRGLSCNTSITHISFRDINLSDENIFHMLNQFLKNNGNLSNFEAESCVLGADATISALSSCKSLEHIVLSTSQIVNGQMTDIIEALSMHPQLHTVEFSMGMVMGRNELAALATLLHSMTELQTLKLYDNGIDDEGIEAFAYALDNADCNLEELIIYCNRIGDKGALILANALKRNCKLKELNLDNNGITADGWRAFSKLLCDASSVNKTYLSNHTLGNLGAVPDLSPRLQAYLRMNEGIEDRGQIAIVKILQNHSHFNVQPFFQWEFKVLPLLIGWMENATACIIALTMAPDDSTNRVRTGYHQKIRRMKLSCIYDFVRELPMLYIEPQTRREIQRYNVMETRSQGDATQQIKLEEVQRYKARAMRRLGIGV